MPAQMGLHTGPLQKTQNLDTSASAITTAQGGAAFEIALAKRELWDRFLPGPKDPPREEEWDIEKGGFEDDNELVRLEDEEAGREPRKRS